MSGNVKRPGYMGRACVAWVILNIVAFATLAALVFILKGYLDRWYVMIPLTVGLIASEWIIMAETLAPIISDWIKQEEYVATGDKPSWQK